MANITTYAQLARLVGAYKRCLSPDANNSQREWADRHRNAIEALVKQRMPSGAGFDQGTGLDIAKSSETSLMLTTSFHHMDEHGSYGGWTEHEIHVRPSLAFGFTLRITGRNRNDIKDLIHEHFDAALRSEVEG